MGPIGAPNHSIGRCGDDCASKGNDFDERQSEIRVHLSVTDLVCAAHLDPNMFQPQEVQQELKASLLQTFGRFDPRHVVDDDGNHHDTDAAFLLQEIFHINVKINRPAEVHNVLDAAIQHIQFYITARSVEQVEAHAANTGIMQSL